MSTRNVTVLFLLISHFPICSDIFCFDFVNNFLHTSHQVLQTGCLGEMKFNKHYS